uniref:Uncharacterized protein n=1 Tax=Triticum urartu TaxID=4572 RepID=A0A8R7PWX9_TRIUA
MVDRLKRIKSSSDYERSDLGYVERTLAGGDHLPMGGVLAVCMEGWAMGVGGGGGGEEMEQRVPAIHRGKPATTWTITRAAGALGVDLAGSAPAVIHRRPRACRRRDPSEGGSNGGGEKVLPAKRRAPC